ncbi:unnamed protein product, partial [Clonostachys solani]
DDLAEELVSLYFRYAHVAFHNIFHQPSVEAGLRTGTLPAVLLLFMASLSGRFSTHSSLAEIPIRERGLPYWMEAEKLIDFYSTSLLTIQACIMAAAYLSIEGDSNSESVFLSVACRMGLVLDLPNAAVETRLERDLNLRVWWSLIAIDTWSSGSHQIPRAMPVRHGVHLPMDEHSFANVRPDEPVRDANSPKSPFVDPEPSIFAQMIPLNQLLYRIFEFSSQVLRKPADTDIADETKELYASLEDWYDKLPPSLKDTPENHSSWARKGSGRKYTILHINHRYAGQLLLFRFLYICQQRSDLPANDPRQLYAAKCKAHAAGLCELLRRADDTPGSDVRYPLIAHLLVVASTIQLFTLLFSPDEEDISRAKQRLEQNFGRLSRLQKYWPNLDASVAKFETFHLACKAGELDVFRMDRWLLKFMLDYTTAVSKSREHDLRWLKGP